VPVGQVASLVAAVYLTSAVAQPAAGKLAEEFGPRRVFLVGTVCILAAGIIGGLAHSLGVLIVARVFIGLGSSTAYPSAMVIIRRRAASAGMREPPGGVLGGPAIAGMAIAAPGLPLGGVLVGTAGWRTTFLVNIPVAFSRCWQLYFGPLPMSRRGQKGAASPASTWPESRYSERPSPHCWSSCSLSLQSTGYRSCYQSPHAPFIDLRLLARNLALTRTYIRVALASLVMYGGMHGVSQWLGPGRHLSPAQTGQLVFPMAIIAAVMLVFGLVMGLFSVSNQTALYSQAPANIIGTAAGLLRTFAYLGPTGSSVVTGIVFRLTVNVQGLHIMAWLFVAAGVVVLAMTIADRKPVTVRGDESSAIPAE